MKVISGPSNVICNIDLRRRVYPFVPTRQLRSAMAGVLVAAICLTATAGAAQHDDGEVRLESDLVAVDITVTDTKGDFVTDLRQSEVRLFEDGRERSIDFFGQSGHTDTARPLSVVIALDISGSITRAEIGVHEVEETQPPRVAQRAQRPHVMVAPHAPMEIQVPLASLQRRAVFGELSADRPLSAP